MNSTYVTRQHQTSCNHTDLRRLPERIKQTKYTLCVFNKNKTDYSNRSRMLWVLYIKRHGEASVLHRMADRPAIATSRLKKGG